MRSFSHLNKPNLSKVCPVKSFVKTISNKDSSNRNTKRSHKIEGKYCTTTAELIKNNSTHKLYLSNSSHNVILFAVLYKSCSFNFFHDLYFIIWKMRLGGFILAWTFVRYFSIEKHAEMPVNALHEFVIYMRRFTLIDTIFLFFIPRA